MIIDRKCIWCDKVVEIVIKEEEYEVWCSGLVIQKAMPTLSVDDREILISGVCGKCFDSLNEY
jgi:hypothetical protein